MKNKLLLILGVLTLISCQKEKSSTTLEFEAINFKVETSEWDPVPFPFVKQIEENLIPARGNQYGAWAYASLGDIVNANRIWKDGRETPKPLTEAENQEFSKLKTVPAKDYILNKARSKDIIIINEAHHSPENRVFTKSLLRGLYDQGYRYLGLEAIANSREQDSILNAEGFARMSTGYYTKEPQFGNMIREAMEIGFELFSYESIDEDTPAEREENQANNIHDFIKNNKDGKYLIHCGFAHASEGNYGGSWEKAMAERLKIVSGIDPFTINQNSYSEASSQNQEKAFYALSNVSLPSVYLDNEKKSFGYYRNVETYFDCYVFHPKSSSEARPKWLLNEKDTLIAFNLSLIDFDGPYMIMAYQNGEPIGEAVPYDIQEVSDREMPFYMVLDKSKSYNIIVRNQGGKSVVSKI